MSDCTGAEVQPIKRCCAARPYEGTPLSGFVERPVSVEISAGREEHHIEQRFIPHSKFLMGDSSGEGISVDGEFPLHRVELDDFSIDATTVTNAQFMLFAESTGYLTDAERFNSSAVFHLLVQAPTEDILGPTPGTPWWIAIRGANWRHPGGAWSNLMGREDHPVVHISWNDAKAYCA